MHSPAKMPSCTAACAVFRKPRSHLSSSPKRAVNEQNIHFNWATWSACLMPLYWEKDSKFCTHTVYNVPDHPSLLPMKLPCLRVQLRTAMSSYGDRATDTSSHLFQSYFCSSPPLCKKLCFLLHAAANKQQKELKGGRVVDFLPLTCSFHFLRSPKNGL